MSFGADPAPAELTGRGRRRLIQFQPGQGLIDLLKFVFDRCEVLGSRLLPAIEQLAFALEKFGDVVHGSLQTIAPGKMPAISMRFGPQRSSEPKMGTLCRIGC
jgi:hypothetical protein